MSKISPKYCLDTHALIWYFTGQSTLGKKAKRILDEIFTEQHVCFIPSIVLLESFHVGLKKSKFVFPKFLEKLRLPNIIVVPLDKVILTTCFRLPKHLDIHDRVICATAVVNESILISKDSTIHKIADIQVIW